jgi:hypothetical protein
VLAGPVLQRAGDGVGDGRIERFALADGAAQRVVHVLRQALLLLGVVEHEAAELAFVPRPARVFSVGGPVANRADRITQYR